MSKIVSDNPNGHLTVQFLTWIAEAPRTYGEAMEAWRTSCPRLSIWEDAMGNSLIRLDEGRGLERRVVLTDRGRSIVQLGTNAA